MSMILSEHSSELAPSKPQRGTISKWFWRATIVTGLATVTIGLAHTPFGRPLLGYLGMVPGCPMSLESADPIKVEAFRLQQLQAHAGKAPAAAHPGLGFELGKATRKDVQAWVKNEHANCKETRRGSVIKCNGTTLSSDRVSSPGIEDVHFQFNASDRLVAVDLFRKGNCGAQALAHLAQLEKDLKLRVGPATSRDGVANAEYLDAAQLHRVGVEFRYSDYLARLSAMNFGERGVRVRESYQFSGS